MTRESDYNGHRRGPVTLTPIAEHLAMELSQPVFTTYVCRGWDLNTQPSACRANALTDCAIAAVIVITVIDVLKLVINKLICLKFAYIITVLFLFYTYRKKIADIEI